MTLTILKRALEDTRAVVRDLEPERLTTNDAARLLSAFDALERSAAAGKTLLAQRAAQAGVWRDKGHRSPASWLADETGTSLGEAIGMLGTAERLDALPETAEALRRGELSGRQVREIAGAAAQNPRAEAALLEMAGRRGFKGLRDECRRVKSQGATETEARARYEAIRKNRFLRAWTDPDGAGRLEARLAPEDFARIVAAVKNESNVIYNEARKAGRRESTMAYEVDALVALVTGHGCHTPTARTPSEGECNGSVSRPQTVMHLRVDLAALRRGRLEAGEVCEIPGVGPVPLATAVGELGEAIVKVIIADGVDVRTVCHVGRTVPGHIRSGLEDRDQRCVVPGCEVERGLEIDHWKIPFAQGGPTELWNLARICRWHHYLRTHCGYELGGEPGSWEWRAPPDRNQILVNCKAVGHTTIG